MANFETSGASKKVTDAESNSPESIADKAVAVGSTEAPEPAKSPAEITAPLNYAVTEDVEPVPPPDKAPHLVVEEGGAQETTTFSYIEIVCPDEVRPKGQTANVVLSRMLGDLAKSGLSEALSNQLASELAAQRSIRWPCKGNFISIEKATRSQRLLVFKHRFCLTVKDFFVVVLKPVCEEGARFRRVEVVACFECHASQIRRKVKELELALRL